MTDPGWVAEAVILSALTAIGLLLSGLQFFAGAFAATYPGPLKRSNHFLNGLGFVSYAIMAHDPQGVFGRLPIMWAMLLLNNMVGLIGYAFCLYLRGVVLSLNKALGRDVSDRFMIPFFAMAAVYHASAIASPILVFALDRVWLFCIEQIAMVLGAIVLVVADLVSFLRLRRELWALPSGTDASTFARGLKRMQRFLIAAFIVVGIAVINNVVALADPAFWNFDKPVKPPTLASAYSFNPNHAFLLFYLFLCVWWCWMPLQPLREASCADYLAAVTCRSTRGRRAITQVRHSSEEGGAMPSRTAGAAALAAKSPTAGARYMTARQKSSATLTTKASSPHAPALSPPRAASSAAAAPAVEADAAPVAVLAFDKPQQPETALRVVDV